MKDYLLNIVKRLERVQKKKNLVKASAGTFQFILFLSLSVFFFILLETLFRFNGNVRTIFIIVLVVGIASSFVYHILFPLIKNVSPFFKIDRFKLAEEVGYRFPNINDDLLNAIQLIEDETKNYSQDLIQAAFKDVYNKTKDLDFSQIVKFQKKGLRNFSLATAAFTLLLMLIVPQFNNAAYRLANYNKEFTEPAMYAFNIEPGNKEVTKGDDVEIRITPTGNNVPQSISFLQKSTEDAEYKDSQLFPDSNGIFVNKFTSLSSSFKYLVKTEDVETDVYEITVIDRPVIRKLELTVNPPSYSNLPQTNQFDNGSVSVLPGSVLEFDIQSTKTLQNASLVLNDSSKVDLSVNGNSASGKLNILHETDYYVSITDTAGIGNENPILYSITTLEDRYPEIEILKPGRDTKLGLENALPLTVEIKDDYGFSGLKIFYQFYSSNYTQAGGEFESIDLTFKKNIKEQEIYYTWDLNPLTLKAGDVLSYYVEVADNDFVNGPKKSKSEVYTIRVPELNELFANADETQKSAESELEQTLKEADELSREMKKINNSLKRDQREISWEEKEKIEQTLDKFETLQEKVEKIQKDLDEMRKDLSSNKLLSEETLNKYMELQDLMDNLSSEEMKSAMQKMREQLQSLMRDRIQDQMENLSFDEEVFKKSLERTLNLLKRIQVEQKVDEIIKRTEEMAKKLEELNKETEQSDLSQDRKNEELSKKQESLKDDYKKMEDEMQQLKDKMSELENMPTEEAEKILEEMKEQNNAELNEQAAEQLQQMQKQEAMAMQQKMMQNMEQQKNNMQNMQQNMQQQNQMKTLGEMVKITEDLIELSKQQEQLKNETSDLPQNSSELRQSAQKQDKIRDNLDNVTRRMSNLSQQTFGITPEMGKSLGSARREMNQSIMNMQNLTGNIAAQSQQKAMQNINEAVVLMKNSINMMMSGGQGGGMMSLMQQLQQMGQQQMNLNQLTQMLNQGQLSQQQMAQLQRLAQEQSMIQKSLEELNKEAKSAGQSKKLSSNLDKILEDMQEVVTNMKSNNLDDDLVQKQERILSKMLDAQRSINERDFEERRESLAGEQIQRESPPELMLSTEEGRNKLRDELLNSSSEGYNRDYQELIRKYFEALQKQQPSD